MLSEIKGFPVANPPWRVFSFSEVLMYYDGPRLSLERGPDNEMYLAWWNGIDDRVERWVCLPLSLFRLNTVLSGQMPSRYAMQHPEGGYLLVFDLDLTTDTAVRVVKTTADAIPQSSLPHPDARLNIPLPPSAQAQWSDAVAPGNAGPSASKAGESVLEMFDRIHREMPENAFDGMPTDGARNYKHYLYGWPKDAE